jgi:hypothetical protein
VKRNRVADYESVDLAWNHSDVGKRAAARLCLSKALRLPTSQILFLR